MEGTNINFLAVIAAAVSAFIIGGLWYSPVLFAKSWQKEAGLSDADISNANMIKIFGTSFVLMLIITINMAYFFGDQVDVTMGIFYGALTGIGWVVPSIGVLYLFSRKSFKLFLIDAGYQAISYTVIGAILGAWH
ncbi:MAG: DUF1761 domain-containing protein [Ignavibacteriales bacterium]|nr:DUF1761 domain-containing protein [Ignavibacteriales bacterium]MCF8316100.1 DUF1761 domain-containing protein [Ignavibacteriales bacterium]MCF8436602.1 DUF1761 domain-containing protein [Ignavibacteriales bacterium]